MEYLVFPFGKYKGVKLTDLPSTYIVLALEKFDLPNELKQELKLILCGRLKVFSSNKQFIYEVSHDALEFVEEMDRCITKYENHG